MRKPPGGGKSCIGVALGGKAMVIFLRKPKQSTQQKVWLRNGRFLRCNGAARVSRCVTSTMIQNLSGLVYDSELEVADWTDASVHARTASTAL